MVCLSKHGKLRQVESLRRGFTGEHSDGADTSKAAVVQQANTGNHFPFSLSLELREPITNQSRLNRQFRVLELSSQN